MAIYLMSKLKHLLRVGGSVALQLPASGQTKSRGVHTLKEARGPPHRRGALLRPIVRATTSGLSTNVSSGQTHVSLRRKVECSSSSDIGMNSMI
jgi:hypothetical protein